MTTQQIGQKLVELCRQGKNFDAMDQLYDPQIVSVEAMSPPGQSPESKGVDACKKKGQMWQSMHEIHSAQVEGPFMHGTEKFAVYFSYDVTVKPSGKRHMMNEVGIYTTKNGKITREEFYYSM